MVASFHQIISHFRFADFLDITVVSVFLYFLFMWFRRKASRSVMIGIATVLLLYILARMLNMYMTSQVFQAGLTAALVGLVIIFQEDIRMAIERITTYGTFHSKHTLVASTKTVDCLVESLCNLARDRIGALVVIKGRESIDRHLNGGISVNGRISVPLLYSIFHPETPSHDGAVIIEGERIEKFAVRLPLSHNLLEVGETGTRHTAALGLAERSDALVIVVSEERGTVSIAQNGHLEKVDRDRLRTSVDSFYKLIFPSTAERTRKSYWTHNAGIKLISLVAAIALWLTFAYRVDSVIRTFTIPVEYRNTPANWAIEDPKPTEVRISLSGPERAFNFDISNLSVSFDVSHIREGMQTFPITETNVNIPSGLSVNQISPKIFSFKAMRFEDIDVPVKARTTGKLPRSLQLTDVKCQPQTIRIQIPATLRGSFSEAPTEPIDLENIEESTTLKVHVPLPPGVQVLDNNQGIIKVSLTVSKGSQ